MMTQSWKACPSWPQNLHRSRRGLLVACWAFGAGSPLSAWVCMVALTISRRFAMVSASALRASDVGSAMSGAGSVFGIVLSDVWYMVLAVSNGVWTWSAKVALLGPCTSRLAPDRFLASTNRAASNMLLVAY